MPKTDTFLHGVASAAPGLVEHRVAPRPRLAGDGWTDWCRHDRWVLDHVDGAHMRCEVSSSDAPAGMFARDASVWHCYAPGTAYREQYQRPRALREWMWFFFIPRRDILPLTARTFSVIADGEGRLAGYCRTMFAHQQRGGAGSGIAVNGLLCAALAEIVAACDRGGDGSAAHPWRLGGSHADGAPALLQRLDRAVSADLASPPSLAGLAATLGMSVSSLAHRFKAESGMTVVERVRWLRIREARRLLAQGESVKRVARVLGFASASWFARVFVATTGMTPLAFQKRTGGR